MKKDGVFQRLVIFMFIVVFTSVFVFALGEGQNTKDKNSDPSSPDFNYASADWSSVSSSSYAQVDWTKVPTTAYDQLDWGVVPYDKIPVENIGSIPKEKIDVNKVRDQSKLTFDHLSYGDNINKVSDWSKLNSDARDSVLSSRAGKPVVLDTGGQSQKRIVKF